MSAAMSAPARILMTGSRTWTNPQVSSDALNATLAVLGAPILGSVLVHGAAKGADVLVASEAQKLGMSTEAHPAQWNQHSAACPDWDKANSSCKLAGFRRNAEMISAGATACLAFPTHGYALAPGENRTETSRGTWNCAEEAKKAGIPTFVVWGKDLYPFGNPALDLLRRESERKRVAIGAQGQMSILEAWLPF